jgi:uncharacterized membrane protein YsdA (DUF1294 family)
VAFWALASDKRRAMAGLRRTPERDLLGLALLGGSAGAIAAQQMFRHKTRKEPFRTLLWSTAAVQVAALVAWKLAA